MELFGENYLRVRNEYLIPLIGGGIPRNKFEYWLLKDVVSDKILSFNKISPKAFEVEILSTDFYAGLNCDIELFLSKTVVQYGNLQLQGRVSDTWSFVTAYYLTFFAATTFLRFLHRGFLFLDSAHTKKLEEYDLAVNSNVVSLSRGNYYFSVNGIDESNGRVRLLFSHKGSDSHLLCWNQIQLILRESLPTCDSSERTLYQLLLSIFNDFPNGFPSNLRNTLNYRGESAIWDLDGRLSRVDIPSVSSNFVAFLASQASGESLPNQISRSSILTTFLLKYVLKLHSELLERGGGGKGLGFLKERSAYLKQSKCTLITF